MIMHHDFTMELNWLMLVCLDEAQQDVQNFTAQGELKLILFLGL